MQRALLDIKPTNYPAMWLCPKGYYQDGQNCELDQHNLDYTKTRDLYTYERQGTDGKKCTRPTCNDNVERTLITTTKIGLVYPSDYGYSTSGGTLGREICLNSSINTWGGYSECVDNSWLKPITNTWSISPASYYTSRKFICSWCY